MIDFKAGKERKVPVSVRLPEGVRSKAQQLAKEQSSREIQITESDVYRDILVSFFSNQSVQNVHAQEVQS